MLLGKPPHPRTPRELLGVRISPKAEGGPWDDIFLELAALLGVRETATVTATRGDP